LPSWLGSIPASTGSWRQRWVSSRASALGSCLRYLSNHALVYQSMMRDPAARRRKPGCRSRSGPAASRPGCRRSRSPRRHAGSAAPCDWCPCCSSPRVRRMGGGREEEVQRVLGAVVERAPVGLGRHTLVAVGSLAVGVALPLALGVEGEHDVAVFGHRLGGVPVHLLVGLDRAVRDQDPGAPGRPGHRRPHGPESVAPSRAVNRTVRTIPSPLGPQLLRRMSPSGRWRTIRVRVVGARGARQRPGGWVGWGTAGWLGVRSGRLG
jgi:hypothetical protein